jgi:HAD superfamily hydrolase (TIGR01509 family)
MILLFDIMDTVVYDPVAFEIPEFFGLTTAQLFAKRDPSAWRAFEVNAISETECLNRLFAAQPPFDHDSFRDTVKRAYRWMDGMEALLADLHARGVEMHALSNYSSWYTMIEERLAVSRFMPWTFVSFETGVRKPAPEAYSQVIDRLGGPASRFLFVDDREVNCEMARTVGMHAIRFIGAEQLRAELTARHVL